MPYDNPNVGGQNGTGDPPEVTRSVDAGGDNESLDFSLLKITQPHCLCLRKHPL